MSKAHLDVVLSEPIGTINPNIYGHFMEHLGACIYDGAWVGEGSSIPNTRGFRNDVIEALKQLRAPVIRWPGGCFADDYHWQDGIGPRKDRPRRINIHWGNVVESNEVGTHEFLDFCAMVGAKPYFCGNLGSGTVREMRDWVEYCNYPGDSTLALERGANGSPEPLGVEFWGVGNENWGCGGNFSPEDYGTEYRRYSTYLRNLGDTRLFLIACGPAQNDLDWTRRFFTKLRKDFWRGTDIHGYAAHYYCGTAGTATEYTEAEWYELLHSAIGVEPLLVQQRALMDGFDPEHKIGLILDEWGTWHRPAEGHNPAFLWQQNTVRDAVVAALSLDIFNRHADKVVMTNIAQTINVLQSMILTEGDAMIKTPTYHVYDLYSDHQGGTSIRTLACTPEIEAGKGKIPQVAGSASLKGSTLTVTLVNSNATEATETTVRLLGGVLKSLMSTTGLVVPGGNIKAHNTFDNPNVVTLGSQNLLVSQDATSLVVNLPAASVTKLTIQI
jgi:alpha-N-arabinofuranosidase